MRERRADIAPPYRRLGVQASAKRSICCASAAERPGASEVILLTPRGGTPRHRVDSPYDPPVADAPQIDGRKLRYAHRREELLAAASGYVIEHGVATLSMRPLAAAIGVAPSALVHHFGTKEQLVTSVLGFIRDRSFVSENATDQDLDAYRRWWYRWDDDTLPVLRLSYEVIGLAVQSPERFGAFRAHAMTDWRVIVAAQLRTSGCPDDEVDAMATSLVAHIAGLQIDLLLTGERDRIDAAHEQFVAMVNERRHRWTPATRLAAPTSLD